MHPILLRCGPVTMSSFFAMAVAAFCVAAFLAARRARQAGLQPGQIRILGAAALFSMVVGSRLGYVAIHAAYYGKHPGEILRIDSGGLALFGGLALAFVVIVLFLRRQDQPVLPTIDRMIPPMVLGQAVIRLGCFLQGCCYGRITTLPWGISYPDETVRRHPTQLYEMAALLGIFAVMMWTERKGQGRTPPHLLTYGLLYGAFRLGTDFLRVGPTVFLIALPLAAVCGLLLLRRWISCTRSS